MARKVADAMEAALIIDGTHTVMWGDGILVDVGQGLVKAAHPLDVMQAVLNALGRDTERFERMNIRGHDKNGKQRIVRGFRLKNSDTR